MQHIVDPDVEAEAVDSLEQWRANRDSLAVEAALEELHAAAELGEDMMKPTLACARAGVTTGEWASALRRSFGEYRAPTGIDATVASGVSATPSTKDSSSDRTSMARVSARVHELTASRGRPFRFLVGKPGLDGHSNGAEQIAVRARDAGFEVIYQGIRLTPEQIVAAAVAEDVDVVGLSILSGSHRSLVPAILRGLAAEGADDVIVVVGGIIPAEDEAWLTEQGVAEVFTPKDYDVAGILDRVVDHLSVGDERVPSSP